MTLQPEEKLREALANVIDPEAFDPTNIWNACQIGARRHAVLAKADEVIALLASYRPDGVGGEGRSVALQTIREYLRTVEREARPEEPFGTRMLKCQVAVNGALEIIERMLA